MQPYAMDLGEHGGDTTPPSLQATTDCTVQTVQKAADLAVQAGSRLYTDSASGYREVKGYVHAFVNHTKKEYARGNVHESRAECLFSLLKPYLRVFRGVRKDNLPGYSGFLQFLRNFHQYNALAGCEFSGEECVLSWSRVAVQSERRVRCRQKKMRDNVVDRTTQCA
jgi:hypothetical protein